MKLPTISGSIRCARQLKRLDIAELHANTTAILPVVVSFTSMPSRFDVVHLTVRSVLSGTCKPEKVVLWLNDRYQGHLPQSLNEMEGEFFEIRYATDDSPHLKLVHSLEAFPDKPIVTCDDDLLYAPNWLETLYQDHLRFPSDIIAHECRAIAYNEQQKALPYQYWYRDSTAEASYDALLPLGFGGVLYPPGCFHDDVCNAQLYLQITPKADDLWFKAMSLLKGIRSRCASKSVPKAIQIYKPKSVKLKQDTGSSEEIRIQWQALVDHYNIPPFLPWAINYTSEISEPNAFAEAIKKPIDAVITWVNGDDPTHAEKMNDYLVEVGRGRTGAATPTRFKDVGEITYCVMSLLKFAPWLRCIHIVTDAQEPKLMQWISQTPFTDKIKIVDHNEIFRGFEDNLPTFNIRSIGTMLWRIPDLADHYLFLNDDFALVQPLEPNDFFRGDLMVLRGHWRSTKWEQIRKKFLERWNRKKEGIPTKEPRAKHLTAQKMAAKIAGFDNKYFKVEHNPHPFRRIRMQEYSEGNSQQFNQQISHKLRSLEQYTPEGLSVHLELAANNVVVDNHYKTMQIKPESQSRRQVKRKLKQAAKDKSIAFVCIQSLDNTTQRMRDLIFSRLMDIIGTLEAHSLPTSSEKIKEHNQQ